MIIYIIYIIIHFLNLSRTCEFNSLAGPFNHSTEEIKAPLAVVTCMSDKLTGLLFDDEEHKKTET